MKYSWLILGLFCSFFSWSQDERYFRQMLSGELPSQNKEFIEIPPPKFIVNGPQYQIDLNQDGVEEIIIPQKRDGVDWIEFRNLSQAKVAEFKIFSSGAESNIYKLKLVTISKNAKAIIVFLDEGQTIGQRFESSARLFVLSFENNDLKTLKLTTGPHFFIEREAFRDIYYRRDYVVSVVDFEQDGIKEISVQFNKIQRIMKYLGKGEWLRI